MATRSPTPTSYPFTRVTTRVWSDELSDFIEDAITQAHYFDEFSDADGQGRSPAFRSLRWEQILSFDSYGICAECRNGHTPLLYNETLTPDGIRLVCIERTRTFGGAEHSATPPDIVTLHRQPKIQYGPHLYLSIRQSTPSSPESVSP